MAHKKQHRQPIPPGNQPKAGPAVTTQGGQHPQAGGGAPLAEQDPKRRLGGFENAGEHSIQQPSAINDGQQHSR